MVSDQPFAHKAKYQWDSTPKDADNKKRWRLAALQIGLFSKWLILRDWLDIGLYRPDHTAEPLAAIEKVKQGKMTGTDFVLEFMDGALIDDFLVQEAQPFVHAYYDEYLRDFASVVGDKVFEAEENEVDYSQIAGRIDAAYKTFITPPSTSPIQNFIDRLFGKRG